MAATIRRRRRRENMTASFRFLATYDPPSTSKGTLDPLASPSTNSEEFAAIFEEASFVGVDVAGQGQTLRPDETTEIVALVRSAGNACTHRARRRKRSRVWKPLESVVPAIRTIAFHRASPPVMARCPFRISVTRFMGTLSGRVLPQSSSGRQVLRPGAPLGEWRCVPWCAP